MHVATCCAGSAATFHIWMFQAFSAWCADTGCASGHSLDAICAGHTRDADNFRYDLDGQARRYCPGRATHREISDSRRPLDAAFFSTRMAATGVAVTASQAS